MAWERENTDMLNCLTLNLRSCIPLHCQTNQLYNAFFKINPVCIY